MQKYYSAAMPFNCPPPGTPAIFIMLSLDKTLTSHSIEPYFCLISKTTFITINLLYETTVFLTLPHVPLFHRKWLSSLDMFLYQLLGHL
jgi:hypothetical protein